MTSGGKTQFAALPLRALSDADLSGSHFRLLATIAYHDRFGKNGQGCYATQATLSRISGIHVTNIPKLAANLVRWGYLDMSRNEMDRRLVTYRVRYDDLEIPARTARDREPKNAGQSTRGRTRAAAGGFTSQSSEPSADLDVLLPDTAGESAGGATRDPLARKCGQPIENMDGVTGKRTEERGREEEILRKQKTIRG